MGFSISGSAAIVFVGILIAFSIFHGAASNSFERVIDAQSDQADTIVDERNVNIEIVYYEQIEAADANGDTDRLTILVNNTGSRELSIDETDLIVDNEYRVPDTTQVTQTGGTTPNPSTNLWSPGERLNITVRGDDLYGSSDRVRIASEHGIADTVVVTGDSKVVL